MVTALDGSKWSFSPPPWNKIQAKRFLENTKAGVLILSTKPKMRDGVDQALVLFLIFSAFQFKADHIDQDSQTLPYHLPKSSSPKKENQVSFLSNPLLCTRPLCRAEKPSLTHLDRLTGEWLGQSVNSRWKLMWTETIPPPLFFRN